MSIISEIERKRSMFISKNGKAPTKLRLGAISSHHFYQEVDKMFLVDVSERERKKNQRKCKKTFYNGMEVIKSYADVDLITVS